jgi:tetratricopeptide (TPR) repeat protein
VEAEPPAKTEAKVLDIPSVKPEPLTPPLPVPTPVAAPAPTAPAASVAPEKATEDILGDFVLDLEESLGDFIPEPEPQSLLEAESDPLDLPRPVEVTPPMASAVQSSPLSPVAVTAHANGGIPDADAASVLSDILSELREEADESSQEAEDPETHYNLGIAFKEMGLLDEAIGELQKVCHAVDDGTGFSQPIQAFTWLAQCLVDKGVPEAAVRWYERALKLPGLDLFSRCSIYYDLGAAYEAFGDKKTALANYMEVYSSNIDFRDVANRIKALKS